MGLVSKTWTVAALAAGAVIAGQFPEFAQQYRQRLGGAVDELKVVVADFDADAARSGLDRDGALEALKNSLEALPRDRGQSMDRTITRFLALTRQQEAMEEAGALWRPAHVLRYPDRQVIEGAWEDFEPAVPITPAGGLWALIGGMAAAFLARLPVSLYRRRKRKGDRMLGVEDAGARAGARAGAGEVRVEGGPTGQVSVLEQLARQGAEAPPSPADGAMKVPGGELPGQGDRMPVLERIALKERLVGEIDASGRFVNPPRPPGGSGGAEPGGAKGKKADLE